MPSDVDGPSGSGENSEPDRFQGISSDELKQQLQKLKDEDDGGMWWPPVVPFIAFNFAGGENESEISAIESELEIRKSFKRPNDGSELLFP